MAKKEKRTYFNLGTNWEVDRVREVKKFGVVFTLKLPGLSLYNLRIVEGKKGKYDDFIAVPEEKGSDGNWYKIYNLFLDSEDTEVIIKEVRSQLK